jgi:hypothetical protein
MAVVVLGWFCSPDQSIEFPCRAPARWALLYLSDKGRFHSDRWGSSGLRSLYKGFIKPYFLHQPSCGFLVGRVGLPTFVAFQV